MIFLDCVAQHSQGKKLLSFLSFEVLFYVATMLLIPRLSCITQVFLLRASYFEQLTFTMQKLLLPGCVVFVCYEVMTKGSTQTCTYLHEWKCQR